MKLLVDAHALLWFFAGSAQLGTKALDMIQDTRNSIFVSAEVFVISQKQLIFPTNPRSMPTMSTKTKEPEAAEDPAREMTEEEKALIGINAKTHFN